VTPNHFLVLEGRNQIFYSAQLEATGITFAIAALDSGIASTE